MLLYGPLARDMSRTHDPPDHRTSASKHGVRRLYLAVLRRSRVWLLSTSCPPWYFLMPQERCHARTQCSRICVSGHSGDDGVATQARPSNRRKADSGSRVAASMISGRAGKRQAVGRSYVAGDAPHGDISRRRRSAWEHATRYRPKQVAVDAPR